MTDNRIEFLVDGKANFKPIYEELGRLKSQIQDVSKTSEGIGRVRLDTKQLQAYEKQFADTAATIRGVQVQMVGLSDSADHLTKRLLTNNRSFAEMMTTWRSGSKSLTDDMKSIGEYQAKLRESMVIPSATGAGQAMVITNMGKMADQTLSAQMAMRAYNTEMLNLGNKMVNFGKNTQWAGRQLMVGLTLPMLAAGGAVSAMFLKVDEAMRKLMMVYGVGGQSGQKFSNIVPTPEELEKVRSGVSNLAKEMASLYGQSADMTTMVAADLAAAGYTQQQLLDLTKVATTAMQLGQTDQDSAIKATIALQNAYKLSTTQTAEALQFFSAAQAATSTNMRDLIDAIPRVGPIIRNLGGTYKDTVAMIVAMKEGGVAAGEGANALKNSMQRIVAPTKAAKETLSGFGVQLDEIAKSGSPVIMIEKLQLGLQKLDAVSRQQAITELFGKYQAARMTALLDNFNRSGTQSAKVMEMMALSAQDLANIQNRQIETLQQSPSMRFQSAIEGLKAQLIPIGEKLIELVTPLINGITWVIKALDKIGPIKYLLAGGLGFTAIIGPMIMFGGLISNLVGQMFKISQQLRMFKEGFLSAGGMAAPFTAIKEGLKATQNYLEEFDAAEHASRQAADALTMSTYEQAESFRELTAAMAQYRQELARLAAGGGPQLPGPDGTDGGVYPQISPRGPMSPMGIVGEATRPVEIIATELTLRGGAGGERRGLTIEGAQVEFSHMRPDEATRMGSNILQIPGYDPSRNAQVRGGRALGVTPGYFTTNEGLGADINMAVSNRGMPIIPTSMNTPDTVRQILESLGVKDINEQIIQQAMSELSLEKLGGVEAGKLAYMEGLSRIDQNPAAIAQLQGLYSGGGSVSSSDIESFFAAQLGPEWEDIKARAAQQVLAMYEQAQQELEESVSAGNIAPPQGIMEQLSLTAYRFSEILQEQFNGIADTYSQELQGMFTIGSDTSSAIRDGMRRNILPGLVNAGAQAESLGRPIVDAIESLIQTARGIVTQLTSEARVATAQIAAMSSRGAMEGIKTAGKARTVPIAAIPIEPAPLATGGKVYGPGGPKDDLIPALLSDGEYVVKADAVGHYGTSFLDSLNAKRLANGGIARLGDGGNKTRSTKNLPYLGGKSIKTIFESAMSRIVQNPQNENDYASWEAYADLLTARDLQPEAAASFDAALRAASGQGSWSNWDLLAGKLGWNLTHERRIKAGMTGGSRPRPLQAHVIGEEQLAPLEYNQLLATLNNGLNDEYLSSLPIGQSAINVIKRMGHPIDSIRQGYYEATQIKDLLMQIDSSKIKMRMPWEDEVSVGSPMFEIFRQTTLEYLERILNEGPEGYLRGSSAVGRLADLAIEENIGTGVRAKTIQDLITYKNEKRKIQANKMQGYALSAATGGFVSAFANGGIARLLGGGIPGGYSQEWNAPSRGRWIDQHHPDFIPGQLPMFMTIQEMLDFANYNTGDIKKGESRKLESLWGRKLSEAERSGLVESIRNSGFLGALGIRIPPLTGGERIKVTNKRWMYEPPEFLTHHRMAALMSLFPKEQFSDALFPVTFTEATKTDQIMKRMPFSAWRGMVDSSVSGVGLTGLRRANGGMARFNGEQGTGLVGGYSSEALAGLYSAVGRDIASDIPAMTEEELAEFLKSPASPFRGTDVDAFFASRRMGEEGMISGPMTGWLSRQFATSDFADVTTGIVSPVASEAELALANAAYMHAHKQNVWESLTDEQLAAGTAPLREHLAQLGNTMRLYRAVIGTAPGSPESGKSAGMMDQFGLTDIIPEMLAGQRFVSFSTTTRIPKAYANISGIGKTPRIVEADIPIEAIVGIDKMNYDAIDFNEDEVIVDLSKLDGVQFRYVTPVGMAALGPSSMQDENRGQRETQIPSIPVVANSGNPEEGDFLRMISPRIPGQESEIAVIEDIRSRIFRSMDVVNPTAGDFVTGYEAAQSRDAFPEDVAGVYGVTRAELEFADRWLREKLSNDEKKGKKGERWRRFSSAVRSLLRKEIGQSDAISGGVLAESPGNISKLWSPERIAGRSNGGILRLSGKDGPSGFVGGYSALALRAMLSRPAPRQGEYITPEEVEAFTRSPESPFYGEDLDEFWETRRAGEEGRVTADYHEGWPIEWGPIPDVAGFAPQTGGPPLSWQEEQLAIQLRMHARGEKTGWKDYGWENDDEKVDAGAARLREHLAQFGNTVRLWRSVVRSEKLAEIAPGTFGMFDAFLSDTEQGQRFISFSNSLRVPDKFTRQPDQLGRTARIVEMDVPIEAIVGVDKLNYESGYGEQEFIVDAMKLAGVPIRYVNPTSQLAERGDTRSTPIVRREGASADDPGDEFLRFIAPKSMFSEEAAQWTRPGKKPTINPITDAGQALLHDILTRANRSYYPPGAEGFMSAYGEFPHGVERNAELYGVTESELAAAQELLERKYGVPIEKIGTVKMPDFIQFPYEHALAQILKRWRAGKKEPGHQLHITDEPGDFSQLWSQELFAGRPTPDKIIPRIPYVSPFNPNYKPGDEPMGLFGGGLLRFSGSDLMSGMVAPFKQEMLDPNERVMIGMDPARLLSVIRSGYLHASSAKQQGITVRSDLSGKGTEPHLELREMVERAYMGIASDDPLRPIYGFLGNVNEPTTQHYGSMRVEVDPEWLESRGISVTAFRGDSLDTFAVMDSTSTQEGPGGNEDKVKAYEQMGPVENRGTIFPLSAATDPISLFGNNPDGTRKDYLELQMRAESIPPEAIKRYVLQENTSEVEQRRPLTVNAFTGLARTLLDKRDSQTLTDEEQKILENSTMLEAKQIMSEQIVRMHHLVQLRDEAMKQGANVAIQYYSRIPSQNFSTESLGGQWIDINDWKQSAQIVRDEAAALAKFVSSGMDTGWTQEKLGIQPQHLTSNLPDFSVERQMEAMTSNTVGAPVYKLATGGKAFGPGGPKDDLIPAMISNGEYVVNADAVGHYGVSFLDAVNSKKLAEGGIARLAGGSGEFDPTVAKASISMRGIAGMLPMLRMMANPGEMGIEGMMSVIRIFAGQMQMMGDGFKRIDEQIGSEVEPASKVVSGGMKDFANRQLARAEMVWGEMSDSIATMPGFIQGVQSSFTQKIAELQEKYTKPGLSIPEKIDEKMLKESIFTPGGYLTGGESPYEPTQKEKDEAKRDRSKKAVDEFFEVDEEEAKKSKEREQKNREANEKTQEEKVKDVRKALDAVDPEEIADRTKDLMAGDGPKEKDSKIKRAREGLKKAGKMMSTPGARMLGMSAMSIGGSLLSNYIQEQSAEGPTMASQAMMYGSQGATMGSAFGPWGTLIGGAAGAALGAYMGKAEEDARALEKAVNDVSRSHEQYRASLTVSSDALAALGLEAKNLSNINFLGAIGKVDEFRDKVQQLGDAMANGSESTKAMIEGLKTGDEEQQKRTLRAQYLGVRKAGGSSEDALATAVAAGQQAGLSSFIVERQMKKYDDRFLKIYGDNATKQQAGAFVEGFKNANVKSAKDVYLGVEAAQNQALFAARNELAQSEVQGGWTTFANYMSDQWNEMEGLGKLGIVGSLFAAAEQSGNGGGAAEAAKKDKESQLREQIRIQEKNMRDSRKPGADGREDDWMTKRFNLRSLVGLEGFSISEIMKNKDALKEAVQGKSATELMGSSDVNVQALAKMADIKSTDSADIIKSKMDALFSGLNQLGGTDFNKLQVSVQTLVETYKDVDAKFVQPLSEAMATLPFGVFKNNLDSFVASIEAGGGQIKDVVLGISSQLDKGYETDLFTKLADEFDDNTYSAKQYLLALSLVSRGHFESAYAAKTAAKMLAQSPSLQQQYNKQLIAEEAITDAESNLISAGDVEARKNARIETLQDKIKNLQEDYQDENERLNDAQRAKQEAFQEEQKARQNQIKAIQKEIDARQKLFDAKQKEIQQDQTLFGLQNKVSAARNAGDLLALAAAQNEYNNEVNRQNELAAKEKADEADRNKIEQIQKESEAAQEAMDAQQKAFDAMMRQRQKDFDAQIKTWQDEIESLQQQIKDAKDKSSDASRAEILQNTQVVYNGFQEYLAQAKDAGKDLDKLSIATMMADPNTPEAVRNAFEAIGKATSRELEGPGGVYSVFTGSFDKVRDWAKSGGAKIEATGELSRMGIPKGKIWIDQETGALKYSSDGIQWFDAQGHSVSTPPSAQSAGPGRIGTIGGRPTDPGIAAATGGFIQGPGTETSDSIPARLSNGEFVVRADSVKKYGRGFLDSINAGRYAKGGYVGRGKEDDEAAESPIEYPEERGGGAISPDSVGRTSNGSGSGTESGTSWHPPVPARTVWNGLIYNSGKFHREDWTWGGTPKAPNTGVNDIGASFGTPFRALIAGTVETSSHWGSYYPGYVIVRHPDGSKVRYAHLHPSVSEGSNVSAGQALGTAGLMKTNSSGRPDGNEHLHFAWWQFPRMIQRGSGGLVPWLKNDGSPAMEGVLAPESGVGVAGDFGVMGPSMPKIENLNDAQRMKILGTLIFWGRNPADIPTSMDLGKMEGMSNVSGPVGSGGAWLKRFLIAKGVSGDAAKTLWAIGMRESGGNPETMYPSGRSYDWESDNSPYYDTGVFQINNRHLGLVRRLLGASKNMREMLNPDSNFIVMKSLSDNFTNWNPWGVGRDGVTPDWTGWPDTQWSKDESFRAYMNFRNQYDQLAMAAGGLVSGPGNEKEDKIPAMLSNGEYVVNANSVKHYGTDFMDSVNVGKYMMGGIIRGNSEDNRRLINRSYNSDNEDDNEDERRRRSNYDQPRRRYYNSENDYEYIGGGGRMPGFSVSVPRGGSNPTAPIYTIPKNQRINIFDAAEMEKFRLSVLISGLGLQPAKDALTTIAEEKAFELGEEIDSQMNNSTLISELNKLMLKSFARPLYDTLESTLFSNSNRRFALGGPVNGPGSNTSDSISAKLSNGEFVMSANAVGKYGIDMMDMINSGRFNPRFSSPTPPVRSINSNRADSSSSSIYNVEYNVSVNVEGSNASPDDIARVVIRTLKQKEKANVTHRRIG